MGTPPEINQSHSLKLYEPLKFVLGQLEEPTLTPNNWWVKRYPLAYSNHGSPFLELEEQLDIVNKRVSPITINHDFFAAMLGGRPEFGQSVIYYEAEMMWYFKDSDAIFKNTTPDKLANQYRALLMHCAQDMPANVHKLNLVHEFRSDKTCKAIIQRAKSILAADHSFFSATSPHQRIKGPELHERLARVLVEEMLQPNPGAIVTVTQAYTAFLKLTQQRQLGPIKRSDFKYMMRDLVRDVHGVNLRNDVPDSLNHHQQAWKGVRLVEDVSLAA